MTRVKAVKLLDGFHVELEFTDGSRRDVDLFPYMHGPIFEPYMNDPDKFREVRVDEELGTIVWPNGADICPDVLFEGLPPAHAKQ